MQRRVPDTTRAQELVGFESTVGIDEMINMVISGLRRYEGGQ